MVLIFLTFLRTMTSAKCDSYFNKTKPEIWRFIDFYQHCQRQGLFKGSKGFPLMTRGLMMLRDRCGFTRILDFSCKVEQASCCPSMIFVIVVLSCNGSFHQRIWLFFIYGNNINAFSLNKKRNIVITLKMLIPSGTRSKLEKPNKSNWNLRR